MTPDTSVLVAGFASWHEHHSAAVTALRNVEVLVGHALLETYSVLTRLPGEQRVDGELVAGYLAQMTRRAPLSLSGRAIAKLPARYAAAGIDGGATYDALIALTADAHDQVLLTRDHRAIRTYQALDVRYRFVD